MKTTNVKALDYSPQITVSVFSTYGVPIKYLLGTYWQVQRKKENKGVTILHVGVTNINYTVGTF